MKFIIKKKIKNVGWKIHIIVNLFILCSLIIRNLNQDLSFETFPLKEIKNIELYLELCNISNIRELYFSDLKKFPKISVISPIYNRGEYLLRFLKSIQNQNFSDIEIILIDDFSSDYTTELIKQYKSKEKRIILIRNKKNLGTFKSRNIGVLKSKGKYIILPDPDDILSQDCLKIFYTFANKYNYEMLRFNIYIGRNNIFFSNFANQTPSRPVFQPELKTFLFYASNKLKQIDFNLANKFIKRDALIRTLNLLNKEYFNMYITIYEDGILNYLLYRTIKSFYFLKKIAYYYIRNKHSITRKRFTSDTIKFIFIHLTIVFDFSKNNFYEKNMFNALFKRLIIKNHIIKRFKLMKNNRNFFLNAINKFLENEFVSFKNKNYLQNLKSKLLKQSEL